MKFVGSDSAKNAGKCLVDDLSNCDDISNYISTRVGRMYCHLTVSVECRPIKYRRRFKKSKMQNSYTCYCQKKKFTSTVYITFSLKLFLTNSINTKILYKPFSVLMIQNRPRNAVLEVFSVYSSVRLCSCSEH